MKRLNTPDLGGNGQALAGPWSAELGLPETGMAWHGMATNGDETANSPCVGSSLFSSS